MPRALEERIFTLQNAEDKDQQHSFIGGMWFMAWLFTIGLLHLTFWKGVLAIVIGPYYLGGKLSFLLY